VEYDLRKTRLETIRIILFHDGNIVRRKLYPEFKYPSHSPALRIVFDNDDYACTGAAPHQGVFENQVSLLEGETAQGDRGDGGTVAVSRLHDRNLFHQDDQVYHGNCYYIGSAQRVSHGHSLDSDNAFVLANTLWSCVYRAPDGDRESVAPLGHRGRRRDIERTVVRDPSSRAPR
jgi:hypothetical protein